jgi:hypothetical protein
MRMRTGCSKWLTSIVLVVACALSAACNGGDAAAAPAEEGAAAQGLRLFRQVMVSVHGSMRDRLAAENFMYAQLEQATAACMARYGFVHVKMPPRRLYAGPQSLGLGDMSSVAPLGAGTFGMAANVRSSAEQADQWRAEQAAVVVPADRRRAQMLASSRCHRTAPTPYRHRPPHVNALTAELEPMFRRVEQQPAVASALRAYPGCMSAAGFKAVTYVDIFQVVSQRMPNPDVGWVRLKHNPRWIAAVAYEKRAAEADTVCRQPAQDRAMAAAAAQLQQFVIEHRAQLDEARASWAELAKR